MNEHREADRQTQEDDGMDKKWRSRKKVYFLVAAKGRGTDGNSEVRVKLSGGVKKEINHSNRSVIDWSYDRCGADAGGAWVDMKEIREKEDDE